MSFTLRPARQSSDVSDAEGAASPPAEPAPTPTPDTSPTEAAVGRLRPSLATLLADEGVATMDQLEEALAEGMKSGERLGEVVLRRGWINEAGLAQLIARRWDLTFAARSTLTVDEHAQALLSRAEAERLGACPVAFNDGVPLIAVADPSEERFSEVRAALGTQCRFVVTTPSALSQLIAESPAETASAPGVETPLPEEPPVMAAPAELETVEAEAPFSAEPALGPADYALAAPEPTYVPDAGPVEAPSPALDDASPALEELDRLLQRLVADRARASDQLAGYRRQLDELNEEKARIEADLRALETKLGEEDELLDTMRTRLSGLTQSLPEH
jgi:Type II secretion system (T2SS), protein E, N-terminal domain